MALLTRIPCLCSRNIMSVKDKSKSSHAAKLLRVGHVRRMRPAPLTSRVCVCPFPAQSGPSSVVMALCELPLSKHDPNGFTCDSFLIPCKTTPVGWSQCSGSSAPWPYPLLSALTAGGSASRVDSRQVPGNGLLHPARLPQRWVPLTVLHAMHSALALRVQSLF